MTRHLLHATPLRLGGVLTAGLLLATGCGLVGDRDRPGPDEDGEETPNAAPEYSDGPFVREGTFGNFQEREASFEVDAVERYEDRTVLRFTTMSLNDSGSTGTEFYSGGILGRSPSNVWLVDPVGQRLYYPAHDDGDLIGSELPGSVVGGAAYKMEAHYPRLPDGVERITVITPGTTGPFTGIRSPTPTARARYPPRSRRATGASKRATPSWYR